MDDAKTVPIPTPPAPPAVLPDFALAGPPILPTDRIKLYSAEEWETFVLEWVDSLRDQYARVERCGSAGDMGRDVIAFVTDTDGEWDNYQCKHYRNPLTPNNIWVELGKLVYYSRRGDYKYPRRYFFVAPRGAGTTLSNLLKRPEELRAGLLDNWERHCRTKITTREVVELDDALRTYITGLDFSIFDATPVLHIIDGHAKTRWRVARFGGGLPARPPMPTPPAEPAEAETVFVRELFNAYSEHLRTTVTEVSDLGTDSPLRQHFGEARLEFYSAESLRTFSRDTLPPGEFENLQGEIQSGIMDEVRGDHADGYRRVVAVVKTARALHLGGHALHWRMSVRDRGGICHQLANDGKVRWVR